MTIRRWDLNGPVYNGMWSYNQAGIQPVSVPETEIERRSTIEENGFEMWKFVFSAHSGTYLETAAHEVIGRPTIDQVDLDRFFRPAKIVRVPTKGPREFIYPEELAAGAPPIEEGDAVLIDTGWGAHWRQPNFIRDTPAYHPSCLDWLMEQPMSIWGVDTPVAGSGLPGSGHRLGAGGTPHHRAAVSGEGHSSSGAAGEHGGDSEPVGLADRAAASR